MAAYPKLGEGIEMIDRAELAQAYMEETGRYIWRVGILNYSSPLPTWAYLKGYRFVMFFTDEADPYALVDPDGRVLKVWLEKPPSLAELWETINAWESS